MRGIQSIINQFRYIRSNNVLVASFFVMALMLTGVGVYQFNQGQAQAAGDCGTNSIVASGTQSYGDITRHYNANTCGDFRAIYNHYWIKPTVAPGDRVVNGTSNNRGEVIADGRVVATNAASIGRDPIKYSKPISINGKRYYQTSHVGGQAFANPGASLPTLVILDSKGNFKNAIIKACGNPVYAKPVPPPKPPEPPKPVVKDIQVCELATKKVITIKEDQFNPQLHSKNLEDCKEKNIQVCDLTTKQVITIKESEYDTTKHSKNFEDCKTPETMTVCEIATKKIITINKEEFDSSKHSTNFKDCEEKKCPIPGKETLPVDSPDCKEPVKPTPVSVPPTTPTELPTTGPVDILGAGIGLAAMGLAIYYYAASRRLL